MPDDDTRARELIYELVAASPVAPSYGEIIERSPSDRARRRRPALIGAALLVFALGIGGLVVVTRDAESGAPTPGVRVEGTGSRQQPLVYPDPSKPPPLRVTAGKRSVDVTTVLGCWSHQSHEGVGVGICADGVVDPSRFQLKVRPGQRVVLRLPVPAELSASIGTAPPPPPPRQLAGPVTDTRAVELRQDGSRRWSFTFPGADHDLALLVDLRVNTTVEGTRVAGDPHYGVTLVPKR